jgi:hypothetical protein
MPRGTICDVPAGTMTDALRGWAFALPEVEEKQHFRFEVPLWQVRGRTFLGMGRDEETAVFCISEVSAETRSAADPSNAAVVRRMDARRSFLGLEVRLAGVRRELLQAMVREAWEAQAPRALVEAQPDSP